MSLSAAASRVFREGSGRCGFTRSRRRRGHRLGRMDADGAPPFLGRADPGSAPPSPETWGSRRFPCAGGVHVPSVAVSLLCTEAPSAIPSHFDGSLDAMPENGTPSFPQQRRVADEHAPLPH
jgi:hypothetical protein